MRGPDFLLTRISRPARRENDAYVVNILSFAKQLRKHGMRDVSSLGRQNEYGIGGDFDLTRDIAGIRDADPAKLDIVFGGDKHPQSGG